MKLFLHNFMTPQYLAEVEVGHPLRIVAKDVRISVKGFNRMFITTMLPKINWKVLVDAAKQIGYGNGLPEVLIDDYENNEEFLRKIHHILMEVDVVNGELICPKTGRSFPISAGVPSFLQSNFMKA